MTSAFDHNLPCLNPNCHSYGSPHPNCKCYVFSEGGEVSHFCSEKRAHNKDCQYFVEGGEAQPAQEAPAIATNPADRPIAPDTTTTDVNNAITPKEGNASEVVSSSDSRINDLIDTYDSGSKNVATPEVDQLLGKYEGTTNEPNPSVDASGHNVDQLINKYEGTHQEQPSSILDELKTTAEGVSQGLIGDLAKVAEVKSGISTLPAIEGRAEDNPLLHEWSKIAGRVGSWVGGPADKLMTFTGSRILGNILAGVAYSGSDNIAKSMLGQPGGDPQSAIAATLMGGGIDGLMNVATDGLFSAVKAPFKNSPELAQKALQWLANKPIDKALWGSTIMGGLGAAATHHLIGFGEGEAGYIGGYMFMKKYLPSIPKYFGKLDDYAGAALMNAMKRTDFFGVPAALEYGVRTFKGATNFNKALEGIFKTGSDKVIEPTKEQLLNDVRDWMKTGGVIKEIQNNLRGAGFGGGGSSAMVAPNQMPYDEPKYAEGGEIPQPTPDQEDTPDRFSQLYPTENMLLHASRARVSNYLNTLRPAPQANKAAFDSDFIPKDKERSYTDAINIAANPLSILNDVNKGTLTPEKMQHFKSMYPEVHDFMANKMTERIIEAQTAKEKPPYNKRQSLSLFLGAHLDSTFSPQAIQTIQGMYAAKQVAQQQQAPTKPKRGTSNLGKSSAAHLTDEQAREKRLQNQKA